MSAYDGPFEIQPAPAVSLAARVPEGYDVRLNSDDRELAAELAGLLSRDVWMRRGSAWIPVQPPRFATALDSWFTFAEGRIRPRTGIASLPLADGMVFTDRDGFVATRAAVGGLLADSITTIAIPIHDGQFRVTTFAGEMSSLDGPGFAAMLGDRWLYGVDLRLWLSWPREPSAQAALRQNLVALAEATGASLWVPPVAGSALMVDGELVARDRAGAPAAWQPFHPAARAGAVVLGSDPDGRLVAGGAVTPPVESAPMPAPLIRRRSLIVEGPTNEVALELVVESPWPAARVAREGLPTASRHVIGLSTGAPHDLQKATRIDNGGGPQGSGQTPSEQTPSRQTHKIRIRVAPGAAIKDPAGWRIPAASLDRTILVESGRPLTLRSTGTVDGLPDDAPRITKPLDAFAVLPASPPTLLAVRKTAPTGEFVRLRLEPGQAIDILAAAEQADETPLLRTRLPELRLAGVELAVPCDAYPKITVVGDRHRPPTTLDQLFRGDPVS